MFFFEKNTTAAKITRRIAGKNVLTTAEAREVVSFIENNALFTGMFGSAAEFKISGMRSVIFNAKGGNITVSPE